MTTPKSQIALAQLNNLLTNLKAEEYPTPETDMVIKEIKKIIKTLAPATAKAPAKKTVAKKVNAPKKK